VPESGDGFVVSCHLSVDVHTRGVCVDDGDCLTGGEFELDFLFFAAAAELECWRGTAVVAGESVPPRSRLRVIATM
jgi:hypothetical protein